jgi:hypothetical protein
LSPPARFARGLRGRQQKRYQNTNDRNYYQQLNQGERISSYYDTGNQRYTECLKFMAKSPNQFEQQALPVSI